MLTLDEIELLLKALDLKLLNREEEKQLKAIRIGLQEYARALRITKDCLSIVGALS